MSEQRLATPAPESPPTNRNGQCQPSVNDNQRQDRRDPRGRFATGNRGGPGNPFARQTAGLRQALVNTVTQKDISDIAAALLDKARQGDVAASKLLFSYVLGKPAAAVDPDTLDQQELHNLAGNHVGLEALQRVTNAFPVELILGMIHAMLPHLEAAKVHTIRQQMAAEQEEAVDDSADADTETKTPEAPAATPPTLDETAHAWEEEVQELKVRLNPTPPAAAEAMVPAESNATEQPSGHQSAQSRPEQPQNKQADDSGGPPRAETRHPPSPNGSNGACAVTRA